MFLASEAPNVPVLPDFHHHLDRFCNGPDTFLLSAFVVALMQWVILTGGDAMCEISFAIERQRKSASDAVDGSQNRHRDVPNYGLNSSA